MTPPKSMAKLKLVIGSETVDVPLGITLEIFQPFEDGIWIRTDEHWMRMPQELDVLKARMSELADKQPAIV